MDDVILCKEHTNKIGGVISLGKVGIDTNPKGNDQETQGVLEVLGS